MGADQLAALCVFSTHTFQIQVNWVSDLHWLHVTSSSCSMVRLSLTTPTPSPDPPTLGFGLVRTVGTPPPRIN